MKLYILYTGGTIGCVGTPLTPMQGGDFRAAFEALMRPMIVEQLPGTRVTLDSFDHTLDSTNLQPADWVRMAQKIHAHYQDFDAFLVLHGTDTMAWTSSALSFLLPRLAKPVTVTGSQLPLFYRQDASQPPRDYQLLYNTDAVRNVLGAVRFLTMGVPEVGLYFADHLLRGNRAVKSNASQFVAFSSPNYPALGEYGVLPTLNDRELLPVPGAASLDRRYDEVGAELERIAAHITQRSVLQFLLFPAYYSQPDGDRSLLVSMLDHLKAVEPPLAGIVFEAYGEGNIPDYPSMQETLTALRRQEGRILVDCTQVFAGAVNDNAYATGAWLKQAGVISGHDMTPIAAMAKLTVLLARHPDASPEEIEARMLMSLAGELTPYDVLSGYRNDFLSPGQSLTSASGDYVFENTTQGTLTLTDVSDPTAPVVKWQQAMGSPGRLVMQSDNNLVFYDRNHRPLWATDTAAIGHNSCFRVGDDGSLALYDLDTGKREHEVYRPAASET